MRYHLMLMRALVVDDDAPVRRLLDRVLTAHGWTVVDAANCEEALKAFHATPFSFIFMDVDLGSGSDGIALARKFREQVPELRVIMMSGNPQNASKIEEAGFGSMLAKPFEVSSIPSLLGPAASTKRESSKSSLLVIEDDPAQLAEYVGSLRGLGYWVYAVQSAEEALRLLQETRVDVILSDNVLPGMTGLRAIPELARFSSAPVLIMTSSYNPECKKDALLLGAAAYLKKPLDIASLHQQMQGIVAANRPAE